jgi:hypothetical protein
MLQVCVDDSGSGQPPVFVLAGFVSSVEGWAAFADEWHEELNTGRTLPYFKMKHAAHLRGVFDGWSEPERDAKLVRLVDIIKRHTHGGIACTVDLAAFDAVMRGKVSAALRNPYFIAFYGIIDLVLGFIATGKLSGEVGFVFDEQGKQVGKALKAWKNWRKYMRPELVTLVPDPPDSRDDRRFLPLQAADMLAWTVRRRTIEIGCATPHPALNVCDLRWSQLAWVRENMEDMVVRASAERTLSREAAVSVRSRPAPS